MGMQRNRSPRAVNKGYEGLICQFVAARTKSQKTKDINRTVSESADPLGSAGVWYRCVVSSPSCCPPPGQFYGSTRRD